MRFRAATRNKDFSVAPGLSRGSFEMTVPYTRSNLHLRRQLLRVAMILKGIASAPQAPRNDTNPRAKRRPSLRAKRSNLFPKCWKKKNRIHLKNHFVIQVPAFAGINSSGNPVMDPLFQGDDNTSYLKILL